MRDAPVHNFKAVTAEDAKRSCLDKHIYRKKTHARDVAAKSKKTKGIELSIYRCFCCGNFHLTRHPASEKPKIKSALRKRKIKEQA